MKNSIEIPGTSMYHVARKLNIGRTTLLKGLRALEVLKADNTPNTEYENVGLIVVSSLVGRYSQARFVPTLKANNDGIKFIQNIILKNPGSFTPPKKDGFKK